MKRIKMLSKTALSFIASGALIMSMSPALTAFADESSAAGPQETVGDAGPSLVDGSGDSDSGAAPNPGESSEGVDAGEQPGADPMISFTVVYKDGVNGKAFSDQSYTCEAGSATPSFSGKPYREHYTFLGWSPSVSKNVTADAVYTAKWHKNVTDPAKVAPTITMKTQYKGGKLKTSSKNIVPGKKATSSTKSKTAYLTGVSFSLSTSGQYLDPSLKASYKIGIEYRVLAGAKWSSWFSNGKTASLKGKKIEAYEVKLTGAVEDYYDIHYVTKARSMGYLGWTKNGSKSGTSGSSRGITAIKAVLLKKGTAAPGETNYPYLTKKTAKINYSLKTSKTTYKAASAGKTAGKASKSASDGVRISADTSGVSGYVVYRVYQKGTGWSASAKDGTLAGKSSSSKKLRAIKMSLKGDLEDYYDIYYRVYIKDYGWLGWAKNGAAAGNTAYDFSISAYQVKLQLKGGAAPGTAANAFAPAGGILSDLAYTKKLQSVAKNMSSSTNWLIICDTKTCRVGIFKGSKGNWTMQKYWLAGVGAYGSPTVKGTFTTQSHVYVFGTEKGYNCWYATQFYGNYLFHSEVYSIGSKSNITSSGLGTHVSHGCVRLKLSNAKWLYNNVPLGTKVKVY